MPEDAFKKYRKKQTALLRPYVPGEDTKKISISVADQQAGSPREGDMIARDNDNPEDQWLVSKRFFDQNYELAE